MDEDYRVKAYQNCEVVFMDEIPLVPQRNKIEYLPVNKRVKKFDWTYYREIDFADIEVTATEPIIDKN